MKTLLIILALTLTGLQSFASEKYYGVDDRGQSININNDDFYIVHGGCRADNTDKLTEIWLYFSVEPKTRYNPENVKVKRGAMFLNQKYGSIESLAICSFLRKSHELQTPVKMEIIQDYKWTNHFLVKSLDMSQILNNKHLMTSKNLLENFSAREE